LSIIKHVTLQKIVAHDFRYDPRINNTSVSDIRTSKQSNTSTNNVGASNYTRYLITERYATFKIIFFIECKKQNGGLVTYSLMTVKVQLCQAYETVYRDRS